jgi:hypothetical protein
LLIIDEIGYLAFGREESECCSTGGDTIRTRQHHPEPSPLPWKARSIDLV